VTEGRDHCPERERELACDLGVVPGWPFCMGDTLPARKEVDLPAWRMIMEKAVAYSMTVAVTYLVSCLCVPRFIACSSLVAQQAEMCLVSF
jgi:hypothetical protein